MADIKNAIKVNTEETHASLSGAQPRVRLLKA